MRVLGLMKADASSEAGAPPDPELISRMGAFVEEATKAGVLLDSNGLHPSASGVRVRVENGTATVKDGPFAEAKEVVASYAIMEVASMEEAVSWTTRFLQVLGNGECELRQVFEPSDFGDDVFPPEEQAREAATREQMARNAARA